MRNQQLIVRQKRAELLSAIGAGILGAGLALLFADALAPYALPLFVVGTLAHAWGMFDKHRLDARTVVQPRWVDALYWFCWLALIAIVVGIALDRLGS